MTGSLTNAAAHDADPAVPALGLDGVSVHGRDPHSGVDRLLLHTIDWRVEAGEHWAILGSNGAGKTTLLNTVSGVLDPTSGSVRIFGRPHGAIGFSDPRLRMAVIEGTPRTFARQLTAIDVVVLRQSGPIALRGQRIPQEEFARARDLLVQFGCAELLERRYVDCSQGERQRILLARTLMRDPALLLLDEPANALDLPGREGLLQAIARLAADRPHVATVTVTHHLEELASSTTHALLLRDGAVVAAGPVAETLTEERLGACFGVPVSLTRTGDRWAARARQPGW